MIAETKVWSEVEIYTYRPAEDRTHELDRDLGTPWPATKLQLHLRRQNQSRNERILKPRGSSDHAHSGNDL